MRMKNVTTSVAIAGALAMPVVLAAAASASPANGTASARTGGPAWAFGVSATGLVNIPQTPMVSSLSGPRTKSLVELPPNPLVKLKVLHTSATPGRSRAAVVDLKVPKAALSAHLVTARCTDGKGSSHLVRASLAGRRLTRDAAPNSTLTLPVQGLGTVSVVLNKQVRNADGGLTVTAIEVKLALAGGQAQVIDVSSATCAAAAPKPPSPTPTPTPTPTRTQTPPPSQAPAPTPVPSDLPVTG